VRAIAYLTAAVLLVIGIGVSVEAATHSPTAPFGTVTGVLFRPRGFVVPPGVSSTVPVAGEVVLTNRSSAIQYTEATGANGQFSLQVPSGTYVVSAHSGSLNSCANPVARVAAGSTVHVVVAFLCAIQ
jgi:hypothetical protein